MPIPPTTILSFGGTAPPLPSAEAGTKYGTPAKAPAPAAVLRNRRRERSKLSGMVVLLTEDWRAKAGGSVGFAATGGVRRKQKLPDRRLSKGAMSSSGPP